MSGGATIPACGCASFAFPATPCNQAGLPAIKYRTGDFVSFRYQLLEPLLDETELTAWRPGASGDLAMQMMEWWAYLGDVLSFYDERIANEAYLGTAVLPESVNHLVQLLGYRPKPALGARGTLAALLTPSARPPLSLPARLQIQSKPSPGEQPQIFEVDQATTIGAPDVVTADVSPGALPLLGGAGDALWIWLSGKITSIKPNDRYLLINAAAINSQTIKDYAWIKVTSASPGSDPLGAVITQLNFSVVGGQIAAGANANDYTLLRAQQSSPLWPYPNPPSPPLTTTGLDLAGVARGLSAGSLILLDVADGVAGVSPTPVIVQNYTEIVWYANPPAAPNAFWADLLRVGAAATASTPPIGIPHSEITFAPALPASWSPSPSQVTVRWGWISVGQLAPVLTSQNLTYSGGDAVLAPAPGEPAFPTLPAPVLLEDPSGDALAATAVAAQNPPNGATLVNISPPPSTPPALASPIDMFFNLVPVSRGKTVPAEILGSGNPVVAGQDFTLSKSPVTYFFDPASISGPNFSSTVTVSVNGVAWKEVQSFYGQPPTAQVFMLRADDQGQTHVSLGDGVNGALPPTGANNISATYRYGAGAEAPDAGTLTVVLTPTPGLKGVANPLAPSGGGDADPPSQLRTLAPRSVLTFNRAVSLDDYAAIALTASGVTQAVASYAFDPQSQRPAVVLWIAGDANASTAAAAALAGTQMPNQRLMIDTAVPLVSVLALTYMRDPRYADDAVRTALVAALADPATGLFAPARVGIGQPIYQSQIAQACLATPGVTAIQNVSLTPVPSGASRAPLRRLIYRLIPRGGCEGCSGQCFSPGPGAYFSVPNDPVHIVLTSAVAS